MTKKDYIAIAKVLADNRKARATYDAQSMAVVRCTDVTADMADMLARENDRFDRGRFLKACGV